jgi:HEAT repeat protein
MPRRRPDTRQLGLFDAPKLPAGAPAAPRAPAAAELSDERLLDALNRHLFADARGLPPLSETVAEAGSRRLAAAAGPLVQLLRRQRGHDRERPSEAAAAALSALAAIGDPQAGADAAGLFAGGGWSAPTTAAALSALAAIGVRAPPGALGRWLGDSDPAVRRAACALAGATGAVDAAPRLVEIASSDRPPVAAAATLALGRLGWRDAKPALEASLDTAAAVDLPAVVEALRPLADAETAVRLGRAADRMDEAGRILAVGVLAEIGGPAAAQALARRTRDPRAAVRLAAARALAGLDGPGAADALARLSADPDPEVAAAAEAGLARREPW